MEAVVSEGPVPAGAERPAGQDGVPGTGALFRRLLAVVDASESGGAARVLAACWATRFGAAVRVVGVPERPGRARSVARFVAEAALEFGADAIVLGLSPERLAYHRLAGGLRDELTTATDLPILVVPAPRRRGQNDSKAEWRQGPAHAAIVPISAARRMQKKGLGRAGRERHRV